MEDWLHFVETFSIYVFYGNVLPDPLRELWDHLRSAVAHYMRPSMYESREAFLKQASTARDHLLGYARLMEELDLPSNMFTLNLHLVACRQVHGFASRRV